MRFQLVLFFFAITIGFSALADTGSPSNPSGSGFQSESEVGAVVTSGNAETESSSVKTKNSYIWEKDTYTAFGHYLRTKSAGTESARNWDAGLRYERALAEYVSAYLGHKAESDPFAGYVQRDSSDIGGKYYINKSDSFNFFTELGYRYQKTLATTGDLNYDSLGRLFVEVNGTVDKTTSLRYWAEYLPNLTRPNSFLANTEASLSVMLYKNLSLKMAYLLQYQNVKPIITTVTPAREGERIDTTYTTSIVAKF